MYDILNAVLFKFFIALFIGLFATGIYCLLYNMFVRPFVVNKQRSKAFNDGRVVVAKCVDIMYPKGTDNGEYANMVQGRYTYTVNNRVYSYKSWYYSTPPDEIELYYKHNPRKAVDYSRFGQLPEDWQLIYLVFVISVFIISCI